MSDEPTNSSSQPQAPEQSQAPAQPQAPAAPEAAVPPGVAPMGAPKQKKDRQISTFLLVSIILLAGLTVASISLLFIGDFDGKFLRVFSTFVLFAVFVVLTAFDMRRGESEVWYAPVALIANAYLLGLTLILIWMTEYEPFFLGFEIFWKSVFVILVTRLVLLGSEFLLRSSEKYPESVSRFAFVTCVLATLTAIMFTAPVGIEAFDLQVPDVYWRISTAILILTALAMSITLLLRWNFWTQHRAKQPKPAPVAVPAAAPVAAPGAAPVAAPVSAPVSAPMEQSGMQQQPQQQSQASEGGNAAGEKSEEGLLPWPRFADGRPYPAGPDNQPDFEAARRMQ